MEHNAETVRCPYCHSQDVHNCGDVLGEGTWHLECNACSCCSTVAIPEHSDGTVSP